MAAAMEKRSRATDHCATTLVIARTESYIPSCLRRVARRRRDPVHVDEAPGAAEAPSAYHAVKRARRPRLRVSHTAVPGGRSAQARADRLGGGPIPYEVESGAAREPTCLTRYRAHRRSARKTKRAASDLVNPSSFSSLRGLAMQNCYTVGETYWIDL
jgi:hypothetical protein